ncbi:IS3 family transposase [Fructobacillus fructosus]|uniref:IS3 family transposase n=1 Tax=Fructobacillus fructosus TaxID=1631 RepID=UPI000E08F908
MLHTDQVWQYRHRTWQRTLLQNGIKPSMSRKATALDNAVIESFFNKEKTEIGPLKQYKSRTKLTKKIRWFIHDYNTNRIQIKLSGQSPIAYRQLAA